MLDLKVKIHDSNSLELKYWLHTTESMENSRFEINSWLVSPSGLEINRQFYSRNQFYSNLRSNFRLITPRYSFKEIIAEKESPLFYLQSSIQRLNEMVNSDTISDFGYHIKMFTSIFKSAIRDRASKMREWDENFIEEIQGVLHAFREIKPSLLDIGCTDKKKEYSSILDFYKYGDEYLIYLAMYRSFQIYKSHIEILPLIRDLGNYRKVEGYCSVNKGDSEANSNLIYRWGELKKFNSSELYFGVNAKKDGFIAEQFYYSLAAGLSMVFATIIAFSFQIRYGNFTMPLFVALIVSYILKDRIKEIMRYYFAHKRREKYFDTRVFIMLGNKKIAWSREGFDFLKRDNIPSFVKEVIDMEDYQVNLYRKLISIDNKALSEYSEYSILGINNIIRRNFAEYFKNMDDATVDLFYLNAEKEIHSLNALRVYYFYLVVELKSEKGVKYERFKIKANRLGLIDVMPIEAST